MSPILGIYASSMQPALNASSFESIATVTVGAGGSSSITFSSIPSTYKHLQIRAISQQDYSGGPDYGWVTARFNSDAGANYAGHWLFGNGASASANGLANVNQIYAFDSLLIPSGNNDARYAGSIMDILDYSNTNKFKTTRSLGGLDYNGGGIIKFNSGLWQSTSAITSIVLTGNNGNFKQYSSFALYGVKG